MAFNEGFSVVKRVLDSIGSTIGNDYDGLIVKELKASNTLDDNRTTNQTHIAITGDQMDMFPYIRADGYFETEYYRQDNDLKKYFVAQIPAYLHKENIEYLGYDRWSSDKKVYISIVRSKRDGAADQIQISMINMDSAEFVEYRKNIHEGDYLIILKQEKKLVYDVYCVRKTDVTQELRNINNGFFKKATNTTVQIDSLLPAERGAIVSHLKPGHNKVYYGTPGCGKSYKVLQEWEGKLYQRTTFYPDYTNSDFVGQVMPGLDDKGQPTYEFVEGPFTKALIDAFNNPTKPVALIIEELNRGNAAAIFGEIFQLLDRDDTGKSQYGIYNPNIIKELNEKVTVKPEGKDFDSVYIPSNLSVIATMNTSDQNVYPLDTAFQRRWKFEKIKNHFLKDGVDPTVANNYDIKENYVSERAYELAKLFIPGTATTWREFVDTLNDAIVKDHDASFSSEDKQIGVYFLSEDELTVEKFSNSKDAAKMFSEKMLKYIWEDVAKLNPDDWFNDCKCLDDVFDTFEYNHLNVFKNMSFKTDVTEE